MRKLYENESFLPAYIQYWLYVRLLFSALLLYHMQDSNMLANKLALKLCEEKLHKLLSSIVKIQNLQKSFFKKKKKKINKIKLKYECKYYKLTLVYPCLKISDQLGNHD